MRGWTIAGGVVLVVLVIILFAVCSDEEPETSTTTSEVSSTTVPDVTTTFPGATTTPSTEETTTTVAQTTTTVDDGLLEGNWARIHCSRQIRGPRMVGRRRDGYRPPKQLHSRWSAARTTRSPSSGWRRQPPEAAEELVCDPFNNPGVVLDDAEALGDWPANRTGSPSRRPGR